MSRRLVATQTGLTDHTKIPNPGSIIGYIPVCSSPFKQIILHWIWAHASICRFKTVSPLAKVMDFCSSAVHCF